MTLRLGLDLGSTAAKAAVLRDDGEILALLCLPAGHAPERVAEELYERALAAAGCFAGEEVRVAATGYGRARAARADKTVTEITCHAAGVFLLHPAARTVIDIGGQDSKAMRLGEGGRVEDFVMNDRCAAGTGSFLAKVAERLEGGLESAARVWERGARPVEISSTCAVFAESEVVGLMAGGARLDDVLAGVQQAVARRVAAMAKQIRPRAPVYFSGGVALNETLRLLLQEELGLEVLRAVHPQEAGAIGAAALA